MKFVANESEMKIEMGLTILRYQAESLTTITWLLWLILASGNLQSILLMLFFGPSHIKFYINKLIIKVN